MSRIETFLGVTFRNENVEILEDWQEEYRDNLKKYVTNCIVSEANNPNYVIYHGGRTALSPEIAYRKSACFSDGLFSGWVFDAGASAVELSGGENKLWKLELNRNALLEGEYPIFIPTAYHLLSVAGNGELFHIRTKVIQAVTTVRDQINEYSLSIQFGIDPIVAGYKLNQTPEYFTTQTPEIFKGKWNACTFKYEYEKTGEGEFDQKGAKALANMLKDIKEVDEDGKF